MVERESRVLQEAGITSKVYRSLCLEVLAPTVKFSWLIFIGWLEFQTCHCEWLSLWHSTQEFTQRTFLQLRLYHKQRWPFLHQNPFVNRTKRVCDLQILRTCTVHRPRWGCFYNQSGLSREKTEMCCHWKGTWHKVSRPVEKRWECVFSNKTTKYTRTRVNSTCVLFWEL